MTEHPDDVSALIERIPLAHYVWCGMQEGTHEAQCDCGFPERMEVVETLERLAAENAALLLALKESSRPMEPKQKDQP